MSLKSGTCSSPNASLPATRRNFPSENMLSVGQKCSSPGDTSVRSLSGLSSGKAHRRPWRLSLSTVSKRMPSEVKRYISPWFPLSATIENSVPGTSIAGPRRRVGAVTRSFVSTRGALCPACRPGHMFGIAHVGAPARPPTIEYLGISPAAVVRNQFPFLSHTSWLPPVEGLGDAPSNTVTALSRSYDGFPFSSKSGFTYTARPVFALPLIQQAIVSVPSSSIETPANRSPSGARTDVTNSSSSFSIVKSPASSGPEVGLEFHAFVRNRLSPDGVLR